MLEKELIELLNNHKAFFKENKTLDYRFRVIYLKRLYNEIKNNIDLINEALYKDLGKNSTEAYMCEIGLVLNEISYMLKNIKKLSKPKKANTPISQAIAKSYSIPTPYGVCLIMSPWNYPFLLSMDPLVECIAAGNVALVKTSEYSANTNQVVKKIIEAAFPKEYVSCVIGGAEENKILINLKFDYIFFTGSKKVGNIVYQSASKNNIPVTLELGGKSPCIVDKSCNLKLAARRIVFGKLLNVGQTCVAPDYLLVEETIKDKLIEALIAEIKKQYSDDPINNQSYGKIINIDHFIRICSLIDKTKVIYGGNTSLAKLKIEPTIMDNVLFSDLVMSQEIFGPIFPIITYKDINEVINKINSMDTPLACYIYSKNKNNINNVIINIQFGGGCINDCIIQLATNYLSFGGFKESGIGSYHGAKGFEAFSHYKSIVDKKTIIDLNMRYQPYTKVNDRLIKGFLK